MLRRVVALMLGAALVSVPASAQYFGRNKVQYEDFDFRVLQTPHFDIYYYPAEHEAVRLAAHLAERWYTRLSRALDHDLEQRQPLVFYASPAHFAQTTVIPGFIGEGVGGVTEHARGRVIMPFAAGLGETDHVLGHELVHAFQRDILDTLGRPISGLPLWFLEGMAEYLTAGRVDANTAMWLRDSVDDRLPALEELDDPRWFPYRYGQAVWSYLAGRFGEKVVADSLKSRAPGGALGRIEAVTGVDAATLSTDWHTAVRVAFDASEAGPPLRHASSRVVVAAGAGGGRLNVGPALSPDGRTVVFLSERDQYSIDLYLADVESGAVTRRLIQTAGDTHFDSLQFIGSAGAWNRHGTRFALAAVHRGQPVLTILDMEDGGVDQEIELPDLDEVFNPSWSPDGRRIVFTALKGGFSDLYVVEIDTKRLRALTADAFADLQPSWSPDGETIAFATDRFTSSLETLSFGRYRLAALDVSSGDVRALPSVADAKHINPQWSADGESVYFVADAGLRSNVYRLDVASGDVFRTTGVTTGVSGVTTLSPALSVARNAERFAYTVYRQGAYELRVADTGGGRRVASRAADVPDARAADDGGVPGSPALGLADGRGDAFTVKPYEGRLSLRGIGQPYFTAGGGSFGTFMRAGVQLSFGDMLGEHSLHSALQVGRGVDDFATQVTYVNRQSRWNWALGGHQIPSVLGASRTRVESGVAGGARTVTTSNVLLRQIHRQVSAVAIYPFSRARRLELSAGLHTVSFDREERTTIYTAGGDLLSETETSVSPLSPATLVETGAALVHDSALFGPTSPILGRRYRFEVAPTLGALTLATVTADYRRYWMPARPFTVAMRLKHTGRYGPAAGDPRLLPLVYDLRDVVRGHSVGALTSKACGASAEAGCAAMQYLRTRRLFVSNLELRFPLVGAVRGRASYGPLPLEGLVFTDGGWLWGDSPRPGAATSAIGLRSAGAGVRVNAAGFVVEVVGVRPFGDASRDWTYAVNFRPGF